MVWFQCEDCGENLKKPKLLNHFRMCSANKLSCIDCGETFGQQSVQGHTQCITEAEKYGPKGQGKASNGTTAKTDNDAKKKPDVDINVGLSSRPPWFCSLCNTNATSKQTLVLHAEGKKHRAKARAFHASKQQPKEIEELTQVEEDSSKQDLSKSKGEAENGNIASEKKRKLEKKEVSEDSVDVSNGEVIQAKRVKIVEAEEEKNAKEGNKSKKIKWKKLITSVLNSNPDGAMKLRKLQKLVFSSLEESGHTEDEYQLKGKLVEKIASTSRFTLDNKLVRLVTKS